MPVDFTKFSAVLRDLGVPGEVRELPESAPTAAAAAAQLGCEVGAIANSLVFSADGAPLLVMTSGAHRVDTIGSPSSSALPPCGGRMRTQSGPGPARPLAASARSGIPPRSAPWWTPGWRSTT